MRLGEQLIRDGLITEAKLEEGLRAQVVYGARIGTNLVELNALGLDPLAHALGLQHGLAAAVARHFDLADSSLQQRISPELAAAHFAIPLRWVSQQPPVVAVAFMDPPAPQAIEQLSAALDSEIVPAVAPELRIRYQLERVYGLRRANRYMRVSPTSPGNPPTTATFAAAIEPPETPPERGERRRYVTPLSAREAPGTLGKISLARRAVTPAIEEPPAPGKGDLDALTRAIRAATDRDQVVDLIIEALREGFDRELGAGIFFLARHDMAIGWAGFSRTTAQIAMDDIAIPLTEPSVLQLAYQSQRIVRGPPPASGQLINQRLWSLLGSSQPAEVAIAPICIRDRVTCLLYTHAADLGPMRNSVGDTLKQVAETSANTFVRLIRSSRR